MADNRQNRRNPNRVRRGVAAMVAGMALALGAVGVSPAFAQDKPAAADGATEDIIILKNGRMHRGKIVSETATAVKIKTKIGTIETEIEIQRSEITEVKKGVKVEGAASAAATPAGGGDEKKDEKKEGGKDDTISADPNAKRVYIIPLEGTFGETVSQTPFLNSFRDAKKNNADVIVIKYNCGTTTTRFGADASVNDAYAWNEVTRVEQIYPVFTEETRKLWGDNPPRIVMLVERALGAGAFFPLAFREIYFTPSARMGGIGTLSELFSGVGDDFVQEKQKSLRLGHVEGWANYGGYDYRIVRAMSRREYVLSFRMVGGKAELFEDMPGNPAEELLTDSGLGGWQDSGREILEGRGNDVLTLDARVAQIVGVSRATVDSELELLTQLGIERNATVLREPGRRVMRQWSRSLNDAKGQIEKAWSDFQDVRVDNPPNYNNRTKARGIQKQKLLTIKNTINRFDEALVGWAQQNRIPPIPWIESRIADIELQQSLDRRD